MKVKAAVLGFGGISIDGDVLSWDDLDQRFWASLQSLTHSDMVYLSRTICISVTTLKRWKAGNTQRRDLYNVFKIIEWVENGKITEKIDDEEFIPWLN